MKYGFGIDIGGTTVKLAYINDQGIIACKWEIPTDTTGGGSRILSDIAGAIERFLKEKNIPRSQILGLGVGVPGPVSPEGVVNRCVNLGWGVFNIEQELSRLTGFPVKAGNDANVAALGEAWLGGGKGCNDMVMATLGTGVGGGIIVDGKILYGSHGAGGEIGHMVLRRDDPDTCGCGKRGCVEQFCSATGIVRTAKRYLSVNDTPSSLRGRDSFTCKDIFDAAKAADPGARAIMEQVYDYMGEFLANLCCVLNPQVVVIGGGVSKAGQPLLEGIARYFPNYVFHACKNVEFRLATLGNDAGALGAFKLVLDEYG